MTLNLSLNGEGPGSFYAGTAESALVSISQSLLDEALYITARFHVTDEDRDCNPFIFYNQLV